MQAAVSLVPGDIAKEWAIREGTVSWKNCGYSLLMRKVSHIRTSSLRDNNKLSQLYWKSKKFEFWVPWVHLKRKMSEWFSFTTSLSHTQVHIQHSTEHHQYWMESILCTTITLHHQIIACLVLLEEEEEEMIMMMNVRKPQWWGTAECYMLQTVEGGKKLLLLHALVQRWKKTVNKYGDYTEK